MGALEQFFHPPKNCASFSRSWTRMCDNKKCLSKQTKKVCQSKTNESLSKKGLFCL